MTSDPCLVPGQASSVPEDGRPLSPAGVGVGGLSSVLEDTVSPAFGASVVVMVTVLVSGGAYLCFLRYVCGGCCQPVRVEPAPDGEGNKGEEQV